MHLSSDGVVDLKWEWVSPPGASIYVLQSMAPGSEEYKTRYIGTDQSSVISGLSEGVHSFRVATYSEDRPSEWSIPLLVKVQYMPAERVRLLLVLGGLVVIMTITTILHGHFTHRRKEAEA